MNCQAVKTFQELLYSSAFGSLALALAKKFGKAFEPVAAMIEDAQRQQDEMAAADVGDERTPLVSASVGLSTEDNNKSDEPEQEIKEAELQAAEETGESHTGEEV